jgi:hypothetical protein
MTPVTTILEDTAERTVTRIVDAAFGRESVSYVYKTGTPQSNYLQLQQRAAAALAANATFMAIASPTQAQSVAQVKALTRQVNALLRIQLNALSDVSDS